MIPFGVRVKGSPHPNLKDLNTGLTLTGEDAGSKTIQEGAWKEARSAAPKQTSVA